MLRVLGALQTVTLLFPEVLACMLTLLLNAVKVENEWRGHTQARAEAGALEPMVQDKLPLHRTNTSISQAPFWRQWSMQAPTMQSGEMAGLSD